MSASPWLGHDEVGGVPSQPRPDLLPPPNWRLDAIYATGRPHHPAVSPDGTAIAFVLSAEGSSDIYRVPVAGGQATRLSTDRALASYWEDSGPQWSPDGSQIAYTSGEDVFILDSEGGTPDRIGDASLGAWLDNERLVVIVERNRTTSLAVVHISDPWPQPFGPRDGDVGQVRSIGDDRVIATLWPRDDFSRSDMILAQPDGEWTTLVGHPDRRTLDPAISGDRVAYVVEDGDWRAVYTTDLNGDEHRLLAHAEADYGNLDWSAHGTRLAATRAHHGQIDLVTIDESGTVETVSTGGFWQSPVWAGDRLVAIHESHAKAPSLIVFSDDSPTRVYDGGPAAIQAAPHRSFERVSITGPGDLELEGFLFRPDDVSAPVPAVVYPHGGPTSVYGDEWDGPAQYFIDKGYAWLAINFRGSTTYGLQFERANHADWAVGDTGDCLAAGRYLQDLDWVDANRIAIFGASYGSYMALAALVHPDNPFACGVAKYGDCDLLTTWAQGDRPGSDDVERMMGHPSTNRDAYVVGSPIHDIERIDRPILVAHGEKDARVHIKQAEQLVAELQRLGKQYEYVTYPEEGHGFLLRDSQIDFYQRLEKFLDWHLM